MTRAEIAREVRRLTPIVACYCRLDRRVIAAYLDVMLQRERDQHYARLIEERRALVALDEIRSDPVGIMGDDYLTTALAA